MFPTIDHRPEYCALRNAIHRCHSPNNKQYSDYGGRGIKVCDEWRTEDGFDKFLKHIGKRPSSDLTLDRIDNDGNYEPDNVRWSTRREQTANRRTQAAQITIAGETKSIKQWSVDTGIHKATIISRIKLGLAGLDLITTHRRGPKKKVISK